MHLKAELGPGGGCGAGDSYCAIHSQTGFPCSPCGPGTALAGTGSGLTLTEVWLSLCG